MRSSATLLGLFAASAMAGCVEAPRDPSGTTERIKASHEVRVALIDGAAVSHRARVSLARISDRFAASVVYRSGHGEELLEALNNGDVDLVYGHFSQSSPWSREVHFGTSLDDANDGDGGDRQARFAFRKGENGWIMFVERAGQ